jgi:hypothetical protein
MYLEPTDHELDVSILRLARFQVKGIDAYSSGELCKDRSNVMTGSTPGLEISPSRSVTKGTGKGTYCMEINHKQLGRTEAFDNIVKLC